VSDDETPEATARLRAATERAAEWLAGYEKTPAATYLPPRRPDLRLIPGGREDEQPPGTKERPGTAAGEVSGRFLGNEADLAAKPPYPV
jgi:hypothetical protein